MLLDEPTAHLDPRSQQLVHGVLAELARSRVVVAVSHRAGLIEMAKEHLVIGAAVEEAVG